MSYIDDIEKLLAENKLLREQLEKAEKTIEGFVIDDCGFDATIESHATLVMVTEQFDRQAREYFTNKKQEVGR